MGKDSRHDYNPLQSGYMEADSRYIQIPLSKDCYLGSYVSEFFEVHNPRSEKDIPVLPDGCNDLIMTFDGNRIHSEISPSIAIPQEFHFDKGNWIFGVRFMPGGTYPFFSDELDYQSNEVPEARLLLPDFAEVEERMCESLSFAKRYEIMSEYLENRVAEKDSVENLLNYCVNRILEGGGSVTVAQLADESGYSDRYIRRIFDRHIGHSPKELAVIIRLQRALQNLSDNKDTELGQIALEQGYADQSHMNRDFRRLLGIPAGAVRGDVDWMAALKTDGKRRFGK